MRPKKSWVRRGQRVLRMVGELHRMGYQRLRIFPYEYPIAWRVEIRAAAGDAVAGASRVEFDGPNELEQAAYSSATENNYFGWSDAASDTARDLAEKFVQRFPNLAAAGRGRDWAYAGWMVELMGELERTGTLPVLFAEYWQAEEGTLGLFAYEAPLSPRSFPLPPNCVRDRQGLRW